MGLLNIDKQEFEQLINLGLKDEEICDYFMCCQSGLNQWIKVTYRTEHPYQTVKKLRIHAKATFLAEQRRLAQKNPTQSIWVGKNIFGQRDPDKVEEKNADEVEDWSPISEMLKDGK